MRALITRRSAVLGASLVLTVVGLAVQSCGSSDSSTFEEGLCGTIYKGLCGKACTTDATCANGLYCGGSQCRADCVIGGSECPQSTTCTARGRCEGTVRGFGDSEVPDGGGGDSCIDLMVNLGKVVPTVVLLIDQSSSMNAAFGAAGSRWDVVRDVLMNPDGGIVKRLEGDVTFGLSLYTRGGASPQPNPPCPRLLSVAAKAANYTDINTLYSVQSPADGTPTGESIDKLIGRVNGVIVDGGGFATLPTPGPKVIVLATDGEPDVCGNGNDEDAGRKVALDAAGAAFAAGIRTYVIGVGDQIGATRLHEMANAGAGQPVDTGDAAPFSTANRDDFVNAMNAIINGVRDCKFSLGGQVAQGEEATGTVTLAGTPLVFNDPNGWRLNNPSELEVLGTACTTIKTTGGQLSVRFPCGAFDVK